MTHARDRVYDFVNSMAQFAMNNPNGLDYRNYVAVEPGSGCYEDLELRSLLDQVGDDRLHAEAVKIYKRGKETAKASVSDLMATATGTVMMAVAMQLDPYEERDGQLVRKSDGTPVTI